jgi:hypothetical protein
LINSGNRSVREVAAHVLHQFQTARPRHDPSEREDPTTRH